tara:strand:+ start:1726 stop:1899 length:174 start_codon:yes stop_codon:yes gene_type:complete
MGDLWATYDAWLEGPATDGHDEPCEYCDDEGCHRCDNELAALVAADIQMDRMKDEGW